MKARHYFIAALFIIAAFGIGKIVSFKPEPKVQEEVQIFNPNPVFKPTAPTTIQIWFNHESQGEAIKKQGRHDFYDLIFFYGTDTGKAAENNGRIVKCRLDADYVEGYVTKKYMGELTVPINKCQELKP